MAEISSMTGSSNKIINTDRVNINIDITSVNNRFLEIYLKMPDSLRHLDSKLRSIIQEKLTRGKIDCYISYALNATDSLNINQEVLHALANAVSQINKELPQSSVNALEILDYPGVISQEGNLQEMLDEEILKNFSEAIDNLKENRKKEGIKLKDALVSRLDKIVELSKVVGEQLDKLVDLVCIAGHLRNSLCVLFFGHCLILHCLTYAGCIFVELDDVCLGSFKKSVFFFVLAVHFFKAGNNLLNACRRIFGNGKQLCRSSTNRTGFVLERCK